MPDTEVTFVPLRAIKPPPHANILLWFGCLFVSVYLPGHFPHTQLVLLHLPGQSSTQVSSTVVPAEFTNLCAKVHIKHWIYCQFQSGFSCVWAIVSFSTLSSSNSRAQIPLNMNECSGEPNYWLHATLTMRPAVLNINYVTSVQYESIMILIHPYSVEDILYYHQKKSLAVLLSPTLVLIGLGLFYNSQCDHHLYIDWFNSPHHRIWCNNWIWLQLLSDNTQCRYYVNNSYFGNESTLVPLIKPNSLSGQLKHGPNYCWKLQLFLMLNNHLCSVSI